MTEAARAKRPPPNSVALSKIALRHRYSARVSASCRTYHSAQLGSILHYVTAPKVCACDKLDVGTVPERDLAQAGEENTGHSPDFTCEVVPATANAGGGTQ